MWDEHNNTVTHCINMIQKMPRNRRAGLNLSWSRPNSQLYYSLTAYYHAQKTQFEMTYYNKSLVQITDKPIYTMKINKNLFIRDNSLVWLLFWWCIAVQYRLSWVWQIRALFIVCLISCLKFTWKANFKAFHIFSSSKNILVKMKLHCWHIFSFPTRVNITNL